MASLWSKIGVWAGAMGLAHCYLDWIKPRNEKQKWISPQLKLDTPSSPKNLFTEWPDYRLFAKEKPTPINRRSLK